MRLKIITGLLMISLIATLFSPCVSAVNTEGMVFPEVSAKSSIMVEKESGEILYEKDSHEKLPPASVTKIMTMLLTVEAIEAGKISLDDVIVCSEKVSKMEGSKVFLSYGEKITVDELLKSVAVASGNDAAVALAEYMAGSEDAFVQLMNNRAQELGMNDTHFANATGLDADDHYTSAYDIAIMSRELLKHEMIYNYTMIWIDYLRDGKFMLANTNRLIRFYEGATGLKTGSTSIAKYCLSASAKKNEMELISVVLACDTSAKRFDDARSLLDFGFANFAVWSDNASELAEQIPVIKGKLPGVLIKADGTFDTIVRKGDEQLIEKNITLSENVKAPVEKNQLVGNITYTLNGEEIGKVEIKTVQDVEKITYFYTFGRLLSEFFMMSE